MAINDPDIGHSLIGVFHDISIKVPPESEIPTSALLPKEWAIFSKWAIVPEEEGRNYFLVSEVYWPNGDLLNQTKTKSATSTGTSIAFIHRHQGFPFGQNGNIKIRLWIEEENGEAIEVVHEPVELSISVRLDMDLVAS
jgi:hypothetical protein